MLKELGAFLSIWYKERLLLPPLYLLEGFRSFVPKDTDLVTGQ